MAAVNNKQATSAAALVFLGVLVAVLAAEDAGTTHLTFFMHDIVSGSSPTAVQVIKGPGGSATAATLGMSFGDTLVMDDPLTETSSPTSAALGRMQGFYLVSAQSGLVLTVCGNLLLTSGDHNGSTIAVLGRDDTAADVRELAVVGGTGKFRMATGYVLWKTSSAKGADATLQLDVYLTTSGNATTIDAGAPVSPAGGGSSAGSSSGSKSSSGAAARAAGGWVAVVVAAVVGSSWLW